MRPSEFERTSPHRAGSSSLWPQRPSWMANMCRTTSWRSFKLTRVCRSSLAAEAAATALDELMMIKTIVATMLKPSLDPRAPATARWPGCAALFVDAKGLYDAVRKPGFTSQQDKRAAVEILCISRNWPDWSANSNGSAVRGCWQMA